MAKKRKPPPRKKRTAEVGARPFPWMPVVILLAILALASFPFINHYICKSECLVTHEAPYPEIACKYACPFPFAEYFRFGAQTQIDK